MDDQIDGLSPSGPSGEPLQRTLPTIEETLEVDKVEVDRGGYRFVKRVSTREEAVEEVLREERVHIEHRDINTAIAEGAIPETRYEGDTLIIPVIEEILITVKRLILVKEVRVTRVLGTKTDARTVTLRKEDIEIVRLAADRKASEPS